MNHLRTGLEGMLEKISDAATWLGGVPLYGPALSGAASGYGDDSAKSMIGTGTGAGLGQIGGGITGAALGQLLAQAMGAPDKWQGVENPGAVAGGVLGMMGGGALGARLGRNIANDGKAQLPANQGQ